MILDTLAESTKIRVEKAKLQITPELMKQKAYLKINMNAPAGEREFTFEKALKKEGISFICEIKKASPSKGIIAENFPYLSIAVEYEKAGADCISVLTEPEFFQGNNRYLAEIAEKVNIPVLRKDFTIDEYQIYEAKVLGASAVLLIAALLDTKTLHSYIGICDSLGLSAVVEAHDEGEVQSAVSAGARIIGVNNRDLKTFEVDINNSIKLRKQVAREIIFVAESGLRTRSDIRRLEEEQIDAVLIGETLMRCDDKSRELEILRGVRNGFH